MCQVPFAHFAMSRDIESGKPRRPSAHGWLCSAHQSLRMVQMLSSVLVLGCLALVVKEYSNTEQVVNTALTPRHRVPEVWEPMDFQCLGWKASSSCSHNGPRLPSMDLPCNATLVKGMAGYCEVRNASNGAIYRVMETSCDSIDNDIKFTCNDAQAFSNFPIQAARYVHHEPLPLDSKYHRGIVFSIYDKAIPAVYAIIQLLRSPSFNCQLPIELFYEPHVFNASEDVVLSKLVREDAVGVFLRTIDDKNFTHFRTKPYALYHSHFQQALLLDCDNIPLRDPTYLFELLNDTTTAVFWPDYWQPSYTVFNVHERSLLWEYLDMPFVGGFEQESGQVLVDRNASRAALHKLMFYTTGPNPQDNTTNFFESKLLVYGDKDLFRLAWTNTSTPFHFIHEPPAFAGVYRWWLTKFCGLSMIQYDANGNMVFLHRNMVKLNSNPNQTPLLVDIARFNTSLHNVSEQYEVECKGRQLGGKLCWGFKWPFVPYQVTQIHDSHLIHVVEAQVIAYAIEAGAMGHKPRMKPHESQVPPGWITLDVILTVATIGVVGLFAWRRLLRKR